MHKHLLIGVLAISIGWLMAGCDGDGDGVGLDEEDFEAELDVQSEVPPVPSPSNASGRAEFHVNGAAVDFTIEVEAITDVIAAHIHNGVAGVAGPIVVTLFAPPTPTGAVSGELVQGTFTAGDIQPIGGDPAISLDSLLVVMGNGNTYVNVHTTLNPAGEIRGQIEQEDAEDDGDGDDGEDDD